MPTKKKVDDVIAPSDLTAVQIQPVSRFERAWQLVMGDISKVIAAVIVLGGTMFSAWMILHHERHGTYFLGLFSGILLSAAGYLGYAMKDEKPRSRR